MLREHPMPGTISLSFEREPNYFTAAGLDGHRSQTIVAQDEETGALLGMGTRSMRMAFVNGAPAETGYLSHLRVNAGYRWGLSLGRVLARAFEKLRELHREDPLPVYLVSVVEDNLRAHRLLAAGAAGLPPARPYARMITAALAVRPGRLAAARLGGASLRRAARQDVPAVLDCLRRNGTALQFAPCWNGESLFSERHTPNLRPEDFFVAERGSRVVGCLALWDQRPFKQTRVRGYSGSAACWRWAVNFVSRFAAVPYLPPPGAQLNFAYASHLAVDGFDERIYLALLRAVYHEAARRGLSLLMTGLAEGHPLRPALERSQPHITYRSLIYLLAWDDGLDAAAQIDGRPPGLEIALL